MCEDGLEVMEKEIRARYFSSTRIDSNTHCPITLYLENHRGYIALLAKAKQLQIKNKRLEMAIKQENTNNLVLIELLKGNIMKVENMTSSKGNKAANQFLIKGAIYLGQIGCFFQSYSTLIAFRPANGASIILDRESWDYSLTTGKYRNQFLGETKAETQKKIDSGEYILCDLN